MRALLLIPLLLLGGLEAAVRPAVPPADRPDVAHIRACSRPDVPATADARTAVKPLPDASRQSALQTDGKPQKAAPSPSPRLVPARADRALRGTGGRPLSAEPVDLRPEQPRAPPASALS